MREDIATTAYVDFYDGVNAASSMHLMQFMNHLVKGGYTDTHLRISSIGGYVGSGCDLYHFLRSLPLNLSTHNVNRVDSVANVIFMAGKQRFVNPGARFMMHGVCQTHEKIKLSRRNLQEIFKQINTDEKTIAEIIASNTKLTRQRILRLFGGEHYFTAEEAVQLGIAHRVEEAKVPAGALHHIITQQ